MSLNKKNYQDIIDTLLFCIYLIPYKIIMTYQIDYLMPNPSLWKNSSSTI